jgi:hypothetical protein
VNARAFRMSDFAESVSRSFATHCARRVGCVSSAAHFEVTRFRGFSFVVRFCGIQLVVAPSRLDGVRRIVPMWLPQPRPSFVLKRRQSALLSVAAIAPKRLAAAVASVTSK